MSQEFEVPKNLRNQSRANSVRIAERRLKVIEKRKTGMSMADIAKEVGCCTMTVSNDLRFLLSELVSLSADQVACHVQLELERLDALWASIFKDASKGNLWKIDRCLTIMERRAKLLGLDKPLQHILAGDKNNPLEVEHTYSIDKLLMDRITRLAASRPENETPTVENKLNVNEGIK
jgi:hypothetical protein